MSARLANRISFILFSDCCRHQKGEDYKCICCEDFDDAKRLKQFKFDSSQDQEIKKNDSQ